MSGDVLATAVGGSGFSGLGFRDFTAKNGFGGRS